MWLVAHREVCWYEYGCGWVTLLVCATSTLARGSVWPPQVPLLPQLPLLDCWPPRGILPKPAHTVGVVGAGTRHDWIRRWRRHSWFVGLRARPNSLPRDR